MNQIPLVFAQRVPSEGPRLLRIAGALRPSPSEFPETVIEQQNSKRHLTQKG